MVVKGFCLALIVVCSGRPSGVPGRCRAPSSHAVFCWLLFVVPSAYLSSGSLEGQQEPVQLTVLTRVYDPGDTRSWRKAQPQTKSSNDRKKKENTEKKTNENIPER